MFKTTQHNTRILSITLMLFFSITNAQVLVAQISTTPEPGYTITLPSTDNSQLNDDKVLAAKELNAGIIHFWNRNNGYVSLRISYTDENGKKRSYTYSNNAERHSADYDAVIDQKKYFKIQICDGCTDLKLETWVMTNAFVYATFDAKPSWGHHATKTDVPSNVNSYFYVDQYNQLKRNDNVSSYSLYEVSRGNNYHDTNMWTGVINGKPVCKSATLPN